MRAASSDRPLHGERRQPSPIASASCSTATWRALRLSSWRGDVDAIRLGYFCQFGFLFSATLMLPVNLSGKDRFLSGSFLKSAGMSVAEIPERAGLAVNHVLPHGGDPRASYRKRKRHHCWDRPRNSTVPKLAASVSSSRSCTGPNRCPGIDVAVDELDSPPRRHCRHSGSRFEDTQIAAVSAPCSAGRWSRRACEPCLRRGFKG